MKHGPLRLLVVYLLARQQVDMFNSVEFNAFVEMSDLKELCPYSQFCGQNASAQFLRTTNYRSCCLSCFCDPDCGLRHDCCSSELEENQIGGNDMICRHLFATDSVDLNGGIRRILENSPHYRMIDKCSSSDVTAQTIDISYENNSSYLERSFDPVFSPTTRYIYINSYCALCNNVSDTVPLRRAIMCPPDAENSLSEFMNHFDSGKHSSDISGCLLYYIPPADILDKVRCYNVIRHCNTTGRLEMRSRFWDFCEHFNATFIVQTGGHLKAYANVYCFLCNVNIDIGRVKEMKCTFQEHTNVKIEAANSRLTVLLDTTSVDRNSVSESNDDNNQCPANSVIVSSFQRMCRPLKCPKGKLLINNRCGYYSKQWIGGPFAVMLRLSPLRQDTSIESSFFTDMPQVYRYDSRLKWLRRKTLKRWKFILLYHPSKNQSLVEYIIVKATYPSDSIDPHVLNRSIKKALEDIWEINYMNSTFSFKLDLNEHIEYDSLDKHDLLFAGINTSHNYGFSPKWLLCAYGIFGYNHYEFLLFPLSYIRLDLLNKGMFVTKLFFCSQVDLLPDEYAYTKCRKMFFKVKNITLHTFSTITVSNTSQALYTPSPGPDGMAVRVCFHEFERGTSITTVTSLHSFGISTMIFYVIKSFCSCRLQ